MASKKILLVEGGDDEHVLKHVCGTRGVPDLDEITPQGSVDQLLENFPVRLKGSDIEALGVVIDADTDINGRWEGLKDRLVKAGYLNIPANPEAGGIIVMPPPNTLLPRFGVWIMPDNQNTGILEDFLRTLVPTGSALFSRAENDVNSIPANERLFSLLAKPKAIMHTWLAWQEEPGLPFGTAIKAGYLDSSAAPVDTLVSWLNRLFFP
jgi:hypothetical protein